MKQIVALVLATSFAAVGCGSSAEPSSDTPPVVDVTAGGDPAIKPVTPAVDSGAAPVVTIDAGAPVVNPVTDAGVSKTDGSPPPVVATDAGSKSDGGEVNTPGFGGNGAEQEPNNTEAQTNLFPTATGGTVTGISTSTADPDVFAFTLTKASFSVAFSTTTPKIKFIVKTSSGSVEFVPGQKSSPTLPPSADGVYYITAIATSATPTGYTIKLEMKD